MAAFEDAPSLGELARFVGRDVSVVSRQLQQIRLQAAVIEKRHGMWKLTGLGKDLNRWTRSAAIAQGTLLRNRGHLRIAAPREFAARILAPLLPQLLGTRTDIAVRLLGVGDQSSERTDGVERLLLSGEADLGLEKDRPHDPSIRFKKAFELPFVAVVSSSLQRRSQIIDGRALRRLPFLLWEPRNGFVPEAARVFATDASCAFDDAAGTRESCLAGHGWTILPRYAIAAELQNGALKDVSALVGKPLGHESFGLWWLRDNRAVEPWLKRALQWVQRMKGKVR